MRYRWLGALCVAAVGVFAAPVVAQDAAPPDAPAVQEPDGVQLAYRFRAGAVYRYRCTVTGRMTIDLSRMGLPAKDGQVPDSMPMDLALRFDLVQKVCGVHEDGTATVLQRIDGLAMNYRMMGMDVAARMERGNLRFTMNGRPMPTPPNAAGGVPQLTGRAFEVRLTPTGQVVAVKGQVGEILRGMFGGQDLSHVFGTGAPGLGMLVLPAEPVQVGQYWEDARSMQLPLNLPGKPSLDGALRVDYRIRNTLQELQQKGPREIAVIGSQVEVTMPRSDITLPSREGVSAPTAMSLDNYSQTVNGLQYFDVHSGELRMGQYDARMGMQMEMAMPGAASDAPRSAMGIDGIFKMKVALLPNVPPKRTASRAAARPAAAPKSRR